MTLPTLSDPADPTAGRSRQWRSIWDRLQPWFGTGARLVLGVVWLVAGATKVTDLAASARAVHAYQLTPYEVSEVLGAALPFLEITLGVLLVTGAATRVAAGVSGLLLAAFIGGIVTAWARGLRIDCGCFGAGGELAAGVDPAYATGLARNIGLMILVVFLLIYPLTRFSVDARFGVGISRQEIT